MSESEHLPGKSTTELTIESFVNRMMDIHPHLDREEFHNTISSCVYEAVPSDDDEEENDGGEQE